MVAEIQYGGRVTDDKDRILLATLTEVLISPRVRAAVCHFECGLACLRLVPACGLNISFLFPSEMQAHPFKCPNECHPPRV